MNDICGFRWYGPRFDVSDAYANHVCIFLPDYEHRKHRCVCGVEITPGEDNEHHPDP